MIQLLNRLNSIVCFIYAIFIVVLFSSLSTISLLFNPKGDISFNLQKLAARSILWFCRVKLHIEGLENIDKESIYVFASNHSSQFDILVLLSIIPVKFGWIAKKQLFKVPFLGWLMKANGYISIDRENPRKALQSMKDAAEKISSGDRIAIFPEGTRSKDGELLPFKKGLFHICVRTGVPIVPIYMKGTSNVLSSDSLSIKPGNVYVKIGKGVVTKNIPTNKANDLMKDIRERFLQLKEEVGAISS